MPARYRILRKIADGGMAEIFLATQHGAEGFERRVVLKRILAALLADPKFRNMMIDEAHVAMSLNHSNIVQVLDLGQSKGRYFLALELVDGWDLNHLHARVKNTGAPMPPEIALYVIAEVCRALGYAHGKVHDGKPLGIVHRDVSPHNVLISEQGEVKLTDFGIAKAMGRRERTGQGVIKGKLAFMSPEQASGSSIDARSDLFSVGTMLYLLFTGRRPFEAPTDLEIILRVQQCQFPPPGEIKSGLPPEVARIIERSMKRSPADRYQSAEEMLEDLETAQRSVFRPAGQTELKRWLVELGSKDRVPPISRAAPLPAEPEDEQIDLLEEDIVFDQVAGDTIPPEQAPFSLSVQRAAEALRKPPPVNPIADTRVDGSLPARESTGARSVTTVIAGSRRGWLIAGLVAGAAAASGIGVVLRSRHAGEGAPAPPPPGPAPTPIAETPRPPADPVRADKPPEESAVATAPPADHPPEADPAVAVEPPPPESPETPETEPNTDDEDEESLLKRQEPDVSEKVIGEEEGTPEPNRPRPSTASARPAPAHAVVSVRIQSRPEGAVISIGRRVLGRAPMNLRFNSGNSYDLTFVKRGYESTRRRITVSRRKGQSVAVSLKKRGSGSSKGKRKNFFQRLLGR
jgi:serine/threonine-protein kinase